MKRRSMEALGLKIPQSRDLGITIPLSLLLRADKVIE